VSRHEKTNIMDIPWYEVTIYYLVGFGLTLLAFGVLNLFGGEYVVFSFSDLWSTDKGIGEGLVDVWFIFAWAIAVPLITGIILRNEPQTYSSGQYLGTGTWVSLHAGIFEELSYRWLRFSIALILLPFMNWILFGFMDGQMGLLRWTYESFFIPLANFTTLGALENYLYHPASWVIGAAIISANGKFQEAHEQNGWFNRINAWFIGMIMFYLMFNYGLLTAIIAHVVYDMMIFTMGAITNSWRPAYHSSSLFSFRT
jgi:hypothetical protein